MFDPPASNACSLDFWPILWISNFEHKVVIMNDSCAKRQIFTYFRILRVLSPKIKDSTPTLLKCRISKTKNVSNRSFWSAILKKSRKMRVKWRKWEWQQWGSWVTSAWGKLYNCRNRGRSGAFVRVSSWA